MQDIYSLKFKITQIELKMFQIRLFYELLEGKCLEWLHRSDIDTREVTFDIILLFKCTMSQ